MNVLSLLKRESAPLPRIPPSLPVETPARAVAEAAPAAALTAPPCLIMLGGLGDILIALCIARHYAERFSARTPFLTSAKYQNLLAGCSYIEPVGYRGAPWRGYAAAVAWARSRFATVYPLHVGDASIQADLRCDRFCHEQYRLAGVEGRYGEFPLVFDRRSAEREAALITRVRGKDARPLLLYALEGRSSPFQHADALLAYLTARWGKQLNLVNTSRLALSHYHDLLAPLDLAVGALTIDTALLHLMPAAATPYIALVNDTRTPWWQSVPRGACALELGYMRAMDALDEIDSAIVAMLAARGIAAAPEAAERPAPRSTTPSFTQQTRWPSGLFTFPASPPAAYFNCSLCEHDGALHLFTRRSRTGIGSDLAIWRFRDDMTLFPTPLLPRLPLRNPAEQWEDPRVVLAGGATCLSCATWTPNKPHAIRQTFARLSPDWTRVEHLWESPYGGNTRAPSAHQRHEKNWIWFQHEGEWHCQYSINPGVVFAVNETGSPVRVHKSRELKLRWQHGLPLRGGTPPTRVGSEYIAFFHTSTPWNKTRRCYHMGAYAFMAAPPFALTRLTRSPLLSGSENDFRSLGGPLVIFPCGALLRSGAWLVTFGVNDEACGWLRIPHADLNSLLLPL